MLRIDLSVPFADKDEVQRLGARWDRDARTWFVPESCDPSAFARWLPLAGRINVRAPSYWIAQALQACWRCRGDSVVHGFALPKEHQTLWIGDGSEPDIWETDDEPTFVCYLEYLLPSVAERMRAEAANYRFGVRRRSRGFYWVNYCQYCNSKLGDYETFCEPGQAFNPLTRDDAAHVALTPVDAPFAAVAGGWSLGCDLFEYMTRRV